MTDDEQQPASDALRRLEELEEGGPWRRKRMNRWDRVVVRDWRWGIGLAGRVLIVIGLLMFGFVAYQLWGTGIETARAQNSLESEFDDLTAQLEDQPVITPTTETSTTVATTTVTTTTAPGSTGPTSTRPPRTTTTTSTTTTAPPPPPSTLPPIEIGDALGFIEIPRIDLKFYVVAGVGTEELKKGVGHYPETPMPGQLGNSALAGHRTTYGHPFFHIDQVQVGDEIIVTTLDGRFVYRATGQQIVEPSDYDVVTTKDPTVAMLTLTSCHPRWSASQRIVVTAALDTALSPPISTPVRPYRPSGTTIPTVPTTTAPATVPPTTVPPTTPPQTTEDRPSSTTTATTTASTTSTTSTPTTTEASPVPSVGEPPAPADPDELSDAFSHGWFSDGAAWPQVVLWGALVSAVAVAAYLLARHFRRLWVGFLVGAAPFVVALYFFYQNVNRLLPSAL